MNYLSQPGSARARVQAGVALVVALAIAFFSSFSLGATAAHAVEGTQAIITDVRFASETMDNGSRQTLQVDWKSPDQTTTPPLSIVVDLPAELPGTGGTKDLFLPGTKTVIGSCDVTATQAVCSIDEDYLKEHPEDVQGGFEFDVTVSVEEGFSGEKVFLVGGKEVTGTINKAPEKCTENCQTGPSYEQKYGWYDKHDESTSWRVEIAAPVAGLTPGLAAVVTEGFDADVFEVVGDPVVYEARKTYFDTLDYERRHYEKLTDGVSVSGDKRVVSFTTRAGLSAEPGHTAFTGAHYYVEWKLKVKDEGKAKTYKNSAKYTLDGVDSKPLTSETTRADDYGWAVGKNHATFAIKKTMAGDATFAPMPSFTVSYDLYDISADPKGVLIEAGKELTVTGNETAEPVAHFFKDTMVVLHEAQPKNTEFLTWGKPVFSVGGTPILNPDTKRNEIRFTAANGNLSKPLEVELVNRADVKRGSFSVEKQLVNDSGSIVAKDAEYTVNWAYPAGANFPEGRGTITLTAGEKKTVGNIPAGAVVTLSETAFPENPGAIWTPSFSKNDVSIVANKTAAVELTNTITREVGSFSVQKQLDGPGAPTAGLDPEFLKAEYTVDYSYPATKNFVAGAGTLTLVAGGPAVEATNIPVGATVTLGEATPVTPPVGTTWQAPTFSVTGGGVDLEKNVFVMKAATKAEFTLTNSLALNTGGFSLAKQLTGAGKGHVPADTEFEVAYSYPAGPGFEGGSGTLQLPADGSKITETGLPYGAVVTFAETAPAAIAGTTWVGEGVFSPETITIGDGTVTKVTLTNTIDLNTGGFSLAKTVEGAGAGHVPDDAEFEVAYSYPKGNGFAAGEGTLTLSVDGTVVTKTGLPYGAVVTFAEAAPAAIVGTTWNEGVFSPKTITIGDGTVAEVSLTNTIDLNTGDFSLVKQLDGAGAGHVAADTEFEVAYSYPAGNGFAAGEGALTLTADGTVVTETGLPYGAVVTFVEAAPEAIDGTTWVGEGVFSPETITIGDGTVTEVTLTNTIDLNTGSFQVLKTVTGSGAALVAKDATFVVTYEYPAGIGFEAGSGSLTVAADGTAVASDELPYGAVLTLGETAPKAIAGGAWLAPKFSAETVTIGDGTVVDVTLTNTFEKGAQLGATGADTLPALLAGAGALILGAAALIVSRIRRRA